MPVNYIINPILPPVSLGKGFAEVYKDDMQPYQEIVLLQTDKPIIIDQMDFGFNHIRDIEFRISPFNSDNVSLTLPTMINTDNMTPLAGGITPERIVKYGSSSLAIVNYESGKYTFSLKEPLYLPRGTRIKMRNRSDSSSNRFAVSLTGREL